MYKVDDGKNMSEFKVSEILFSQMFKWTLVSETGHILRIF